MNSRDDESVDWLDLGPDPDEGKPPSDPRRRYLWYALVAAGVVLALVLTRAQHGTNRVATAAGSPSPTGSPSASSATPSAEPTESGSFVVPSTMFAFPSASPLQQINAGHQLLDVPADWELFARAPGLVLRIQLARGRVTVTRVPEVSSGVPVTFLVGADRAIVRPQDDTTGSVVRDGQPATELPQSLRPGGALLPGTDQRHLWAEQGSELVLLTLDGQPAGATIEIPPGGSVQDADGAGYALLSGIGGTYDARPGSVHRVTGGLLLATGPTRWLATECDDSLACATVVTDRATGARHSLGEGVNSFQLSPGSISPDGKTAALPRFDGDSANNAIDLLDLASGIHRPVEVSANPVDQSGPSFVWSPDSRWLFAVNGTGEVLAVNRATGKATALAVHLPPVSQVALRHR